MSFGARGLTAAALGDDMVFAPVIGTLAVKADAFMPDAAIAPPKRTANLPAMPPRNNFLSFCIPILSIQKMVDPKIVYRDPPSSLIIFPWHPEPNVVAADRMPQIRNRMQYAYDVQRLIAF